MKSKKCIIPFMVVIVLCMFFTAFYCTDPTKPDFGAELTNKQIQTLGKPVVDSLFKLYVTAKGEEPLSYIWIKNDTIIVNATSDIFTFSSLKESDSGKYQCAVWNEWGADTTLPYTLEVFTPPSITTLNKQIQTSPSTPKLDSLFMMFITAKGSDTLKYEWYFNGTLMQGKNDSALTFTALSYTDTGKYICKVINSYGFDTSAAYKLTILQSINHPPKWDKDTIQDTITEEVSYKIALSDTCSDPDGDSITFKLQSGLPANDSITSGKIYTFTPSFNDSGTYSIIFWANDGKDSSKALLKLTVLDSNRAPLFKDSLPLDLYQLKDGAKLTIKFAAVDYDSDSVSIFLDTNKTTLPRKGTIVFTDTQLVWQSSNTDSGLYNVTLCATDKKDTTIKDVSVAVGHVNIPPQISIENYQEGDNIEIKEGKELKFTVTVSDPDSGQMPKLLPAKNLPQGAVYDLAGTINPASVVFKYTPAFTVSTKLSNTKFNNVTFYATDSSARAVDSFYIHITVLDSNRVPQFKDSLPMSSYKIKEGEKLTVNFAALDPDNDSVNIFLDTTNLPHKQDINFSLSKLEWQSTNADSGTFFIQLGVTDKYDTAYKLVTIGIGNVNLPPDIKIGNYIEGDTLKIKEGKQLQCTVTVIDPDSGQTPKLLPAKNLPSGSTYDIVSSPNSGNFSYTPAFTVSTKQSDTTFPKVTFFATDSSARAVDSFFIHIQVLDSNRAPACKDTSITAQELTPAPVNIYAMDPDSDPLHWNIVQEPKHGSVSKTNGSITDSTEFTYTSNNLVAETRDTIKVTIEDGISLCEMRVFITINSVNNKPIIDSKPPVNAVEDNSNPYPVNIAGHDPEGSAVKWYIDKLPKKGTLDKLEGAITPGIEMLYTLKPDSCGKDTLTFYLLDAQSISSDTQAIIITIDSVNDKPVITGYNDAICDEDNTITLQITHLKVTDIDNHINDLKLLALDSANYRIISGTTIKPDTNFNGYLTAFVKVSDGKDTTTPYGMRVTVNPVNDKPEITITSSVRSLLFGDSVNIATAFSDVDNNIDSIFYVIDAGVIKQDKISALTSNYTYNWKPAFGPYVIDTHEVVAIIKDTQGARDTTEVFKIEVLGTYISDTLSVRAILDANGDNSSINDYCHFNMENRIDTIAIWYASYTQLPSHIGNITKLINLILIKSKLSTLPPTIGNLNNLMMLNLFDNELTTLPNTVTHLNQITALDLFQNRLPINSHEPWADNWADIYCDGWRTNQKSK